MIDTLLKSNIGAIDINWFLLITVWFLLKLIWGVGLSHNIILSSINFITIIPDTSSKSISIQFGLVSLM